MPVALFLLFLVVAGAFLYLSWWQREHRRRAFATTAAGMGLTHAQGDPFGLVELPFVLFRQGDGRGVDHVMHGRWQDMDVKAFDYWFFVRRSDGRGMSHREYRRYSCVLLSLDVTCPITSIGPETMLTRLADKIGAGDIDFESEEFNRKMEVKSTDRRFASYLLDARMMEWLLQARKVSFELSGRSLLCYEGRFAPPMYATLLDLAAAFRSRIPRVVHDIYGSVR